MKYDALNLIGNTPLVRLSGTESELGLRFSLFGKLERFNPSGSVKDRAARAILLGAMARGELRAGETVIDASSGNMGISLAMLGGVLGLNVIICIPEGASRERAALMRAYGAQVNIINGDMACAIAAAKQLSREEGYYYPDQFENPDNPISHYNSTAPEIYNALAGKVDYIICGVGTGGTLKGISNFFRVKSPQTRLIAVEPESSAVLSGKPVGKHNIQGIGAGFVPTFFNTGLVDLIITVSDNEAIYHAGLVTKADGIAVGFSSGATLAAVMMLQKSLELREKQVVCIFPDGIDRYISLL